MPNFRTSLGAALTCFMWTSRLNLIQILSSKFHNKPFHSSRLLKKVNELPRVSDLVENNPKKSRWVLTPSKKSNLFCGAKAQYFSCLFTTTLRQGAHQPVAEKVVAIQSVAIQAKVVFPQPASAPTTKYLNNDGGSTWYYRLMVVDLGTSLRNR